LRIVSAVASIVALVPGPWQLPAQIIAVASGIGAALLQKKPPAQGSTNGIQIGANMPMPYAMGRTYVGGGLVHDVGYGGTVNDVPNPYRSMAIVGSHGGPIESIEAFQADFATIAFSSGEAVGYYENFLWLDSQLGDTPEASALAGPFGAIPQWGAAYKLSGMAAWLATLKFDKKGKRWAAGVPQFGVIGEWVKAYDARLDDTYAGGAGDHRFDDEATFEWTENPSLHATTYARGRYQGPDDVKVIGCGFVQDAIDWPAWVAFANVCDANDWKVGGTIYEGPGISKWDNLKRICAAGAAEPAFVGGLLSVRYAAPKVALDTIVAGDLADGDCVVPAMKSWRDRKNGIIPRYRSEDHKWEYVQSALVTVEDYVTEDGEEKNEERQFDLVQDKDQAAQLAAYELVDARELGPIVLPCKPRLIEYKPGEALEVDIPELGLVEQLCVIKGRSIDPGTAIVTLTLETETTAKHAFALGQTGTAPPTPTIATGEEMDEAVFGVVPSTPDAADWDAVGSSLASPGGAIPAIVITGAVPDTDGLLGVQFTYRVAAEGALALEGPGAGWLLLEGGGRLLLEGDAAGPWISAMLDSPDVTEKEIVSVTPGTRYDVGVQYVNRAGMSDRLVLGPVEVGILLPAESVSIGGEFTTEELTDMRDRITALE
jgi:hypothetical protein